MDNSESVMTESLPVESDGPHDIEGLMVDALRAEADEDSSFSATPSAEGETEPDSDESAEAKTEAEDAEVEATTENKEEEFIPKSSFLKRINGLQAGKRKLEESNLAAHRELSEYREAFRILQQRAFKAESELSKFQDVDPRDQQLRQMTQEREAQEIRAKLEQEHAQRVEEQQKATFVENRADEIIHEANFLADKYPTLTPEEIVYKFRVSDKTMSELAKEMHDSRYSYLRESMAKDHKRPKSPRPVKSQGGMAPVNGSSEDDMADYLSAIRS